MLEMLHEYAVSHMGAMDAKSVRDFRSRFVADDAEDAFYIAIRDTRYAGFREGLRTALQLLTEILETDGRAKG